MPALALTGGALFQQQQASVESLALGSGQPPRPPADGVGWDVSPYFGGSMELMTPAITRLRGHPRVFVSGEILALFPVFRHVAVEGDATEFQPPDLGQFPEEAIRGVGSKTTGELHSPAWAASIGIAFPFELRGRQLRVKPSFGWIRYDMAVEGAVLRAFKPRDSDPFVRYLELRAQGGQVLDGIGPGLEIEMELGRWGPLRPSLFIGGHAYRVLGERTVELYDRVTITDQEGTESYTAHWLFEANPWLGRAGVGLRVRWLGN